MENNALINEIITAFLTPISVVRSFNMGRVTLNLMSNQAIMYQLDHRDIDWFYSKADTADQRKIDTRSARIISCNTSKEEDIYHLEITYEENDLQLTQIFDVQKGACDFKIRVKLKDLNGVTATNHLIPLDFIYPKDSCDPLFLSLDEKMLVVPYDNDMWVNYEVSYLSSGRTSYDVTYIFNDDKLNGLLIGALEFDHWKNAIIASGYDARVFQAISGVADLGTHDSLAHGVISAESVCSAAFVCGYFDSIFAALDRYAALAADKNRLRWNGSTVFGWNSYSALAMYMDLNAYEATSAFFETELDDFKDDEGIAYINLDAVFIQDKEAIRRQVEIIHSRHQKAGTYMAPLAHIPLLDEFPLLSEPQKKRKDTVLKKPDGSDYHPVDGKLPVDITLPFAEEDLRMQLREVVDMGFDYLKIDFLSHGALEGKRYDSSVRTGREALMRFYQILHEELNPLKINKTIFLSSSIAPLFPAGQTHARRCCCDAFGHHEDVRYVLNALNYGFWTNGKLYEFNDPDHTVLYSSTVDQRGVTSFEEARSRYLASAISGTVMLLSDNVGPKGDPLMLAECRERIKKITSYREVNQIARMHKAFRPLSFRDTADTYYLKVRKGIYIAVFNFDSFEKSISLFSDKLGIPLSGKYRDLYTEEERTYENGLSIPLKPYDSAICYIDLPVSTEAD